MRRTAALYAARTVVTRRANRSLHRTTYGAILARANRLGAALRDLGVRRGDRVATLCWNHDRHLEAYIGVPAMGAVLHTLNLRLHPDELAYIAAHADDRVLIADVSLWPLVETWRARAPFAHVIIVSDDGAAPAGTIEYETLLASGDERSEWAEPNEDDAAAMCYTSGTTGRSKGVVYSHRAIALHSMALGMTSCFSLSDADVVLAVVPMFHANAWGLPHASAFMGAAQVLPGPHLDAASLLELLEHERVTLAAGVPTVWMALLAALDAAPGTRDLSSLRALVVGGAAAPESLIRAFEERHGLNVLHAWGMTETAPLGSIAIPDATLRDASPDAIFACRATQGQPAPFFEIRARRDDGALVPWDGASMGELEVRGAWVASEYYANAESADRFTADGWFRTGDIVSIDAKGYLTIRDREKDLVKSGGEWISSVALENALMAHASVLEAAVIAVPHPKWQERPLAIVVARPGTSPATDALLAHLESRFPKWWIPDAIELVDTIPRTSVGKFQKSTLRERYRDRYQ
jgi:fatty-acyl-CoA synthase